MKIQRILSNLFFSDCCFWCKLPTANASGLCASCTRALPLASITPMLPNLDDLLALFRYQPPISQWMMRYKFQGDLSFSRFFAHSFIEKMSALKKRPDLLLPVPLYPKRLRERGFNQALEIAKPIAKHFSIPLEAHACIKIKHTPPQSTLSRAARLKNLKNTFALSKTLDAQHVAIIDDVITTGSTITQIANLLRTCGIKTISAWCCAVTDKL